MFTFAAVGVSYDCCSNTYCGTSPASEPEAQAVTKFVGSRKDDFLCFLTIHSYGQLLLVPYGHPNFTADNYDELVLTPTEHKDPANQIPHTCERNYTQKYIFAVCSISANFLA